MLLDLIGRGERIGRNSFKLRLRFSTSSVASSTSMELNAVTVESVSRAKRGHRVPKQRNAE
jgi:hypothetical protein